MLDIAFDKGVDLGCVLYVVRFELSVIGFSLQLKYINSFENE